VEALSIILSQLLAVGDQPCFHGLDHQMTVPIVHAGILPAITFAMSQVLPGAWLSYGPSASTSKMLYAAGWDRRAVR